MKRAPDWEAFGRAVMGYWPHNDEIPMDELQEWAVHHGILRRVQGGFNPEYHIDDVSDADVGDEWFEPNFR